MPAWILPGLLAAGVVLAWWRLLARQRAAAPDRRAPAWRLLLLLALQPAVASLLYLTLVPPPLARRQGDLILLTRGGTTHAGEAVIALPEAEAGLAIEHAPDLATALRRHPGAGRLLIRGEGLERRDREAAAGHALLFDPPPLPSGILRLDLPAPVAPGAAFRVSGLAGGGTAAVAELLDPAGARIDAAPLAAGGAFVLGGTARDPGATLFTLRLRNAGGAVIEQAPIPVLTIGQPAPRVFLIAGAPGPDVKYLRRWAGDAGLSLHSEIHAGGGTVLGDARLPLTAATLARFDVVIVDERGWAAIGAGGQAALIGATRGGLGLLLRIGNPLDPVSAGQWRRLGFGFAAPPAAGIVQLAREGIDQAALRARRGAGTRDTPAGLNLAQNEPPPLTRAVALLPSATAVPLLRAANGNVLASWKAAGQGRIGVLTVADSFALALAGQREHYGEMWSEILATLARPSAGALPDIERLPRVAQRMSVCKLTGLARVSSPAGRDTGLIVDPAVPGCAAYWPENAGWHFLIEKPSKGGASTTPFYVQPVETLPALRAAELGEGTLRLTDSMALQSKQSGEVAARRSSWPWFLAWLLMSGGLWWFERLRSTRDL